MGKSLLEFQSNKGDVLPPHKFGTHDVVVLKPNKSDLESPPPGQGVVYRIKDTSITVACDDIPEEGLNSPLRLEKLANEGSQYKLGQPPRKGKDDRTSAKLQSNVGEPLPGNKR